MRVAVVHDWLVIYGGAERVLEHILDMYPQADVFSLCFRMMGHRQDAEDVVQEVWLSLYEHLDRIHSPELVRSWLCRVTANAALRSQTRSSRVILGPDVGEGPSGENTEDQGLRRAAQDELFGQDGSDTFTGADLEGGEPSTTGRVGACA